MAKELTPIDVSRMPDLLRIAEEVGATGVPRLLKNNDRDLAIVAPVGKARSRKRAAKPSLSPEDREAFRAAAGSWKDVDTDRLVDDIYSGRRAGDRPPVDL